MYIYYVYAYLRNKDSATAKAGTPYYIGKGSGQRAFNQHRTNSKGVHVPQDKTLIQFIAINLSEHESHLLEQKLINHYGRKDISTGILRNMTDGGDGTSGYAHTKETKNKIAISRIGKSMSILTKSKLSIANKGKSNIAIIGIPRSAETKQKLRDANLGKKASNATKIKLSLAKLGKSLPKITCPHCSKVGGAPQMKQWHFDNCKNK